MHFLWNEFNFHEINMIFTEKYGSNLTPENEEHEAFVEICRVYYYKTKINQKLFAILRTFFVHVTYISQFYKSLFSELQIRIQFGLQRLSQCLHFTMDLPFSSIRD